VSAWLRWRGAADRAVAVVLGIAAAPVVAVLAVVIAVVDRTSPLVGLRRVGRRGAPFTMWKLRTMRPGDAGPGFTVQADPRVTGLGRRLRRWRLDELPQLWNVIRGEMALLGPRPEAPEYVDAGDPGWQRVLAARPGVAGPTQVAVHGWEARITTTEAYVAEVVPRKLEIDGWYVAHAGPAVDLDVLRSVLWSVLRPDRPTPVHRRLEAALPETMAVIARAGTA